MSSISSSSLAIQAQVLVARKQLDQIEQQGRDALALIDSATPEQAGSGGPPANVAAGVGTQLNVVA